MAVSYKPLWKTLIDKGIKKSELGTRLKLSSATIAKMGRDEYVALKVLETICTELECPIEAVVEVIPDGAATEPDKA